VSVSHQFFVTTPVQQAHGERAAKGARATIRPAAMARGYKIRMNGDISAPTVAVIGSDGIAAGEMATSDCSEARA
jgi:hypothetical protein